MKNIYLRFVSLAVLTTPVIVAVSCNEYKKIPYVINSEHELINFDVLRAADESAQREADATHAHAGISTNLQTKGRYGDLLTSKVLSKHHNTFYLDLLNPNDKSKHLVKNPIVLSLDEVVTLSKFLTKILIENPQNQITKRIVPITIKSHRKELIEVLNLYEYAKNHSSQYATNWNNIFVDTPKVVDPNEAKKHPYTVKNLSNLLIKKMIASSRQSSLLKGTTDITRSAVFAKKNTWFWLDPSYDQYGITTRVRKNPQPKSGSPWKYVKQKGKVLKSPIGITRPELVSFATFYTEFIMNNTSPSGTKMILPADIRNNRSKLIEMMNKLRDRNHEKITIVDHK